MGNKPVLMFQCEFCGKVRERRKFRTKAGIESGYDRKQRFCSKDCGYKGRKWRPISDKGYLRLDSGYRMLHLRGGKKVLFHRNVMEKTLGRPLTSFEQVHHRDGNRDNNTVENLELWTKRQPPGQRVTDKVQYAIDMLLQYPEYCTAAGFVLHRIDQDTGP